MMVDVVDHVKKYSLCYSFTLIYQEKQASFAFHITPTAALKVGQTDTKLCLKEELLIKKRDIYSGARKRFLCQLLLKMLKSSLQSCFPTSGGTIKANNSNQRFEI